MQWLYRFKIEVERYFELTTHSLSIRSPFSLSESWHAFVRHFIRYTLLVPGWTYSCFQSCFISSWHRFKKVLETVLVGLGPYWHGSITQLLQIFPAASMMWITCSTTSQRCSIGLRSGDYEAYRITPLHRSQRELFIKGRKEPQPHLRV